ncbi:MAG: dockerin type I domain-containing protein [Planctomycetota bacterium]
MSAHAGVTLPDLGADHTFSTDFVNLEAGQQVPAGELPTATFEAPGAVVFIQNPDFYLAGSNRSWGFTGPGSARITFSEPIAAVSIAARGSALGDQMGPIFGGAKLGQAKGLVRALDRRGRELARAELENISLRSDASTSIKLRPEDGEIAAIELSNLSMDPEKNSMVVIGGMGVTPVCPADVNASGAVDFGDVLDVIAVLGQTGKDRRDVNGDGGVDFGDILEVIAAFGTSCGGDPPSDPTGSTP